MMGMPADYMKYFMRLSKEVVVEKEDIEYMYLWSSAKMLSIMGENNVSYELQRHLEELRKLYNVEDLHMDVSMVTYMKLLVRPFLEKMHSLHKATFYRHVSISLEQFVNFVEHQTRPSGWGCMMADDSTYTCTKP